MTSVRSGHNPDVPGELGIHDETPQHTRWR